MNTKSHICNYLRIIVLVLLTASLTRRAAASAIQYTNEFWISTNATGNFYTGGTGGTIDNPYDGSSQANFDANMAAFPPNSTIHIMPGVYQTAGDGGSIGGYKLKSGQRVLGSGIDITVLKFCLTSSGVIMDTWGGGTNNEVADLTCDGNNQANDGVWLDGTGIKIRRVKVVNLVCRSSSEVFGILISNYGLPDSTGNVIEDCELSSYGSTQSVSAICLTGGLDTPSISGIVRDNKVFLPMGTAGCCMFGINSSWTHDSLIEGNYVNGGHVGCYEDTGGATNLIVAHNHFVNVGCGVGFANDYKKNLTFDYNYIEFTNEAGAMPAGFFFNGSNNPGYTNVIIMGNTVVFDGSGTDFWPGAAYFVNAQDVTGLEVFNNSVDSKLTNYYSGYYSGDYGVNIDNNFDLYGNYLTGLNLPMVGGTPVTSLGETLIGSAGASPALTALGLPGNPLAVVTNGSTIPISIATNLTVNGNLAVSGNLSVTGAITGAVSLADLPSSVVTNGGTANLNGQQTIVFTPTNGAGWYRLTVPNACNFMAGNIRIMRDFEGVTEDNTVNDIDLEYHVQAYASDPHWVGTINMLHSLPYGGGGVQAARVGCIGGGAVIYVDLYVATTPTNAPITVQISGGEGTLYAYTSIPYYEGTTNMPPACKVLNFGSGLDYGLVTSDLLVAGTNATILTDSGGKILNAALNTVQPNNGGLGFDASGAAGNMVPYTTGTGGFGLTPISYFISPSDGYVWGGPITPVQFQTLQNMGFSAWYCASNSVGTILKNLPLPADYWGGKLNYVSTWKVRTTNSGSYKFDVALADLLTNDLSDYGTKAISFTAPAGTNTFTVSATNSISTTNVNALETWIYTGDQVQPGNFYILSGKVTAQ